MQCKISNDRNRRSHQHHKIEYSALEPLWFMNQLLGLLLSLVMSSLSRVRNWYFMMWLDISWKPTTFKTLFHFDLDRFYFRNISKYLVETFILNVTDFILGISRNIFPKIITPNRIKNPQNFTKHLLRVTDKRGKYKNDDKIRKLEISYRILSPRMTAHMRKLKNPNIFTWPEEICVECNLQGTK